MTGTIEIRGLRVVAAHGALPGEQEHPQPFEVDLDVEVETARAAETDELQDAVDYGRLVEVAAEVVRSGPFRLLETLAERVAGAVVATPGVASATVTVRKLRPPVPFDLGDAGVRIERRSAR